MNFPVLCFGRDGTVDVSPDEAIEPVPLSWVQYYAHETDLHVWATGNQQLQIEAGIPTPYEARQMMINNGYDVKYMPGGGDRYRTDRLNIINQLYTEIAEDPEFIVVDNKRLDEFCNRHPQWDCYGTDVLVDMIDSIGIPEPDEESVTGVPYYNTEENGTYNEMLEDLEDTLRSVNGNQ